MGFAGYVIVAAVLLIVVGVFGTIRQRRRADQQIEGSIEARQCRVCRSPDCAIYKFYDFRSVGIYPFAYYSLLEPRWQVLCRTHAREASLGSARSNGLKGFWGFPGCVLGLWYSFKNIWALKATESLTFKHALKCAFYGMVYPWLLLLGSLVVLILCLALVLRLSD